MTLRVSKEKSIKKIGAIIAILLSMLVLITPMASATEQTSSSSSSASSTSSSSSTTSSGTDTGDTDDSKLSSTGAFPYIMAKQITSGATDQLLDFFNASSKNEDGSVNKKGALYRAAIGGLDGNNGLNNADEYSDTNYNTIFKGVNIVFKLLGYAIAIVIGFIRMFKDIEKGQDPVETVLKFVIEIFFIGLIIINVEFILSFIAWIGDAIINAFGKSNSAENNIAEQMLNGMGFKLNSKKQITGVIKWVKAVAMLIIPWAASFLCIVGGYLAGFSIIFDLLLRRIFTPIAIADIYGEGLRSPGTRYLKRYLSCFIKIAIVLAVCLIAGLAQKALAEATFDNTTDSIKEALSGIGPVIMYVAECIGINLTAIITILKGGELANEVVGA